MTANLQPFSEQISLIEKAMVSKEASSRKSSPFHQKAAPVHVVYGGAHMFTADFTGKLSRLATEAFEAVASDGLALKALLRKDWSPDFSRKVYGETLHKLSTSPIEDYRIDFEDGYGLRPDEEEDRHALSSAQALVEAARNKSLPRFVGIRPKPFSIPTLKRSLRTLLLFVEELSRLDAKKAGLNHLTVTLPKITSEEQVAALASILEILENTHQLGNHFFGIELLIETPEAFLSVDGSIPLPRMIASAKGRCTGVHFGVYDFTSSIGIGSAGQSLDHFSCDVARFLMQVSVGLFKGIALSDGIINTLPLPRHRATAETTLTGEQIKENKKILGEAWRVNFDQMLRSLEMGFYQGWDLHPSQVAIRHLVNRVYVLEEFDGAAKRLKGFLERSAQATRLGGTFDDRASAVGLVSFMERAVLSGILTYEMLEERGLNLEELKKL